MGGAARAGLRVPDTQAGLCTRGANVRSLSWTWSSAVATRGPVSAHVPRALGSVHSKLVPLKRDWLAHPWLFLTMGLHGSVW